jgi:peptide deformylase
MDHLQGKLFVDRLSFLRKMIFRATARRRLQQAAKVADAPA